MALIKPTRLRALGVCTQCLYRSQRRWAQVHDVRFLVTHENQRVADKYHSKLQQKARQEGYRDVEQLKEAYQKQKRKTPETDDALLDSTKSSHRPQSSPHNASSPSPTAAPSTTKPSETTAPPGLKTLASFLDIPKTRQLPQQEIEYIWRLRHASDPRSLCAVVPDNIYSRIEETARRHPQFILPLPRDSGAEIHYMQWTFPSPTTATILFTHLAEFKTRGEFAQPHTTVTHHLDMRDKGLVLLQGNVLENRGVSVDDGKWLLMCLQKFYGGGHERTRLLEQFSGGDNNFRIETLIEEADKIV